jgi:hypothetical protein
MPKVVRWVEGTVNWKRANRERVGWLAQFKLQPIAVFIEG